MYCPCVDPQVGAELTGHLNIVCTTNIKHKYNAI